MIDLQSGADYREIPIGRVGISELALPVKILEKTGDFQHVVVRSRLFVEVPSQVRGTHLSRLVELLGEWANEPVSSADIERLLSEARERTGSPAAEAELAFKYFLPRQAPISRRVGLLDYGCEFIGRLSPEGFDFTLGVVVPITTLCPCSKEISDAGAHNQRATVRLRVRCREGAFIWLEDLISLIEAEGSSPLYPVLKRIDEKHVTEAAYQNPKFVEDVVRDLTVSLSKRSDITWLSVECESQESIHNHNALAQAEFALPLHEPSTSSRTDQTAIA